MAQATHEFVLVHGAAHGAWCWDDVARRLESKGHRVVTLDLPGHGRRAAEAGQASVAAYARAMRVPCTYIRCLRDGAVPLTKATEYAARLGMTPIDLDTDHDPMLSAPEALVRVLDRI
jgi:pimeloyl-ACP methyl ester carboxylesterase